MNKNFKQSLVDEVNYLSTIFSNYPLLAGLRELGPDVENLAQGLQQLSTYWIVPRTVTNFLVLLRHKIRNKLIATLDDIEKISGAHFPKLFIDDLQFTKVKLAKFLANNDTEAFFNTYINILIRSHEHSKLINNETKQSCELQTDIAEDLALYWRTYLASYKFPDEMVRLTTLFSTYPLLEGLRELGPDVENFAHELQQLNTYRIIPPTVIPPLVLLRNKIRSNLVAALEDIQIIITDIFPKAYTEDFQFTKIKLAELLTNNEMKEFFDEYTQTLYEIQKDITLINNRMIKSQQLEPEIASVSTEFMLDYLSKRPIEETIARTTAERRKELEKLAAADLLLLWQAYRASYKYPEDQLPLISKQGRKNRINRDKTLQPKLGRLSQAVYTTVLTDNQNTESALAAIRQIPTESRSLLHLYLHQDYTRLFAIAKIDEEFRHVCQYGDDDEIAKQAHIASLDTLKQLLQAGDFDAAAEFVAALPKYFRNALNPLPMVNPESEASDSEDDEAKNDSDKTPTPKNFRATLYTHVPEHFIRNAKLISNKFRHFLICGNQLHNNTQIHLRNLVTELQSNNFDAAAETVIKLPPAVRNNLDLYVDQDLTSYAKNESELFRLACANGTLNRNREEFVRLVLGK